MKKYISGLITGILITLGLTVFAAAPIQNAFFADNIKLNVNGTYSDVTFVNVDGYNYAKVRDVVSAMGGNTEWDSSNNTILVSTNKEVTSMSTETQTQGIITVDGKQYINIVDVEKVCKQYDYGFAYNTKLLRASVIKSEFKPTKYINDIPLYEYDTKYYIDYEFYVNSILTLIGMK